MFAVLGAGEALARLVAFGATVFVARRLGASGYGILAVATAVVLYFNHFADWSVEIVGARELAQGTHGVDELAPPLIAARLLIALACVVLLSVAGFFFLPQPDGAILAATSFTLLAVAGSTRFVFLGTERPGGVATVRIAGEALALLLVILLVRDAGDLGNVPLARVAGDTVGVLVLALLLRSRGYALPVRSDPALVRPVLRRASPLVAHAILGLIIFNSDLIFLRALRDAHTAGLYAVAYTLVSFLLNLGITYGNSLLPVLSRLAADPPRQRELYDSATAQVLALGLPIATGGCLLAMPLIVTVFGAGYAAAGPVLQILIWSVVASLVRTVVQMALIAHHEQGFVLRTSAWSAAANLVLNALLIPRYGMPGAAFATLVTEVVRTVIALVYAGRLGMPFGVARRLLKPLAATAVMALALWKLPLPNVGIAIALGILVYGVVLAMTGGITLVGGKPVLAV
jgi:O-antigen/teichoic acid export membrane protein